jgi:NADPH2:quinone reductase
VFFGRFAALFPEAQRQNMREVLQWCADGTLKPHVQEVLPLSDTIRALKMIEAREAVGKIVVRP